MAQEFLSAIETVTPVDAGPLGAAWQELQDLHAPHEAEDRAMIDAFMADYIGTAVTPREQVALSAEKDILEWMLLGKIGDPLPNGLLKVTNHNGTGVRIMADPRIAPAHFTTALFPMRLTGLNTVCDRRIQERQTVFDTQLFDHFRQAVAQLPLGKRLFAFAETPPQMTEQVLPEYVQASRRQADRQSLHGQLTQSYEAAVDHAQKTVAEQQAQTGSESDEPIVFTLPGHVAPPAPLSRIDQDAHARTLLRGPYYRIGEETMLQPELKTSQTDPLATARTYVSGLVRQGLQAKKPDIEIFGQPYFESNTLYVDTNKGKEYLSLESLLSEVFANHHGPLDYRTRELENLTYDLARGLFRSDITDYQAFLSERLSRRLQHQYSSDFNITRQEPFWDPEMHGLLKQPTGDVIPFERYLELLRSEQPPDLTDLFDAKLYSRKELDKLQAECIGTVAVSPEYQSYALRVIQYGPRDETLPAHFDGKPAITMVLEDSQQHDPFVPGFTLVSRKAASRYGTAHTFEFMPSPAGDPYSRCDLPVPQSKIPELAAQYERIGLVGLAAKVLAASDLTVDQLRKLIIQESTYYYPERTSGLSGGEPGVSVLGTFVKNGRLNTQCTVSAYCMAYSLDTLFGAGTARVIRGDTLKMLSQSNLTKAGHAQTVARINGRLYIMDATPGAGEAADGEAPFSPTYVHPTPMVPLTSVEFQTTLARLQLEDAKKEAQAALEHQLRYFFKAATNEQLYEKIVRLREDDPIRRAVAFVRDLTTRWGLNKTELDSLVTLYDTLTAEDRPEEAIHNLGWSRYTPSVLQGVRSELLRVRRAYLDKRAAQARS